MFRLVSHNDEHFPPNAEKPHPEAFRLTNDDRDDGKRRNLPSSLSVFEVGSTTVEEGRAIRKAQATAAGRTASDTTPFALDVARVRTINVPQDFIPLDVVSDPLDPMWGPGSNGHAGITGLDGRAGSPDLKNKLRGLRSDLRDICYRIPG